LGKKFAQHDDNDKERKNGAKILSLLIIRTETQEKTPDNSPNQIRIQLAFFSQHIIKLKAAQQKNNSNQREKIKLPK
jgi:hypothetical protein